MATVQEFSQTIKQKYPEYKDVPDDKLVNAVVKKYPQYASRVQMPEQERMESNGTKALNAIGSTALDIGKSLISAPARVASTAGGIVQGVGGLGGAALSALAGDKEGAQRQVQQAGQDIKTGGAFGQMTGFKPIGVTLGDQDKTKGEKITSGIRDIVGTGLEAGTSVLPAGKALGVGKKTLGALGALSGSGSALGTSIREGATLPEAVASTAMGAGLGLLTGGVLGKASPKVAKAVPESKLALATPQASSVPKMVSDVGAAVSGVAKAVPERAKRAFGTLSESVQKAGELAKKPEVYQKAINVGLPEDIVQATQIMPKSLKQKARQMLDIGTKETGKLSRSQQPKDVVGDEVIKRISPIVKAREKLGKEVDRTRRNVPLKLLDVTDEYQQLADVVRSAGAKLAPDGYTIKVSGGSIPANTAKKMSEVLKALRPNNQGSVIRTGKYLDSQRQKFFKMYQDSLTTDKPFTPEAIKFVEQMRSALGDKIDTVSKGYMKAQQDYAQLMGELKDIVKTLGLTDDELKAIGLDKLDELDIVALQAGEKAMRTLGNAASKQKGFLRKLTEAASRYGYKTDVDLDELIALSDAIEQLTGSTPTRSLQGGVTRGVEAGQGVLNQAAEDFAEKGILGGIIKSISRIGAARSPEQIAAFRELLK